MEDHLQAVMKNYWRSMVLWGEQDLSTARP
jgi:hypothetical protein